jgi:hypothetical protein
MSSVNVSIELRRCDGFRLDIMSLPRDKLTEECGFIKLMSEDIPVAGQITMDVPDSCNNMSIRIFAKAIKKLCDDEEGGLKRKQIQVGGNYSTSQHVFNQITALLHPLATNDVTTLMGVLRIAQKWDFHGIVIIVGGNVYHKITTSPECTELAINVLRDNNWDERVFRFRKDLMITAAARLLDLGDIHVHLIDTYKSLQGVDLEAMRGEAWMTSAFELLARSEAELHRRFMRIAKILQSLVTDLDNDLDNQRDPMFQVLKTVGEVML